MGRRRTVNKHLPRRMVYYHGAYYHVAYVDGRKRWTRLSDDFAAASAAWARIEGATAERPRTVADLMAAYIAVSLPRLAIETVRGYRSSQKRLGAKFGHMPIGDLRREHVYRYIMEAKRAVAANRDRALLGAAYTHAQNMGWKGVNPAHGLRRRAPERPRDRYVTDDEATALVRTARAMKRHAMACAIQLAWLTGMDEAVIVGLQVTAGQSDGIHWRRAKTLKRGGRLVIVGWSDALRAIWREMVGDRIGAQPVFRQRSGNAYTSGGFRATWRKVKLKAGLPGVQFRDLRRKAGSDADSDAHAADLLGHAAGSGVTRKHYRVKAKPVRPVG